MMYSRKQISIFFLATILCIAMYFNLYKPQPPTGRVQGTKKLHFQFDIPVWSPGFTCEQGDVREECNKCKIKVRKAYKLLYKQYFYTSSRNCGIVLEKIVPGVWFLWTIGLHPSEDQMLCGWLEELSCW